MSRLLLLLGLALLQVTPELTGHSNNPVERPHVLDEADVDSLTPVTGERVPVRVDAIEGVPAAARERDAFLKGFRGAFVERALASERVERRTGVLRRGGTLRNGLRLADAPDEKGAWGVRVWLEWFTPQDSTLDPLFRPWPGRGARVTVTVARPEVEAKGAAAVPRAATPDAPRAATLRFPAGHPVDAAYYQQAGRQVGFLALEAVLRARGDLDDDQRLRLEDTRRLAPDVAR